MISTTPGAQTTDTLSGGGLTTGLTITGRLKDGDETLPTVVTVTALLDSDGDALPAYKASFTAPANLPVVLEYVLNGSVVGFDVVAAVTATPAVPSARLLLSNMTSATTEPTLSTDDLDLLLQLNALPDSNYDYNAAAAEGWRWKAAKAASSYAFTMDGDSPERSFLMIRCEHMVEQYRKKIVSSVPITTDYSVL